MNIKTLRHGDNFIYLLLQGPGAAVVDPGAAQPVAAALDALECRLDLILLTHHHAEENLEFAAFLDPENAAVRERLDDFRRRAAAGDTFEPSTLAEEKRTNPFLRCRDAADFARVRSRKDAW